MRMVFFKITVHNSKMNNIDQDSYRLAIELQKSVLIYIIKS